MAETHPQRSTGLTIKEFTQSLPPEYIHMDPTGRESLREAIEEELRHHELKQEDIDRCRFHLYPSQAEVHWPHGPYALQTLNTVFEELACWAWTWLSPHVEFWSAPFVCDWRAEMAGHANSVPEDSDTGRKLAATRPAERFARTQGWLHDNPLKGHLWWLHTELAFTPGVNKRILPSLVEKGRPAFYQSGQQGLDEEERRKQAILARKQLTSSARLREEFTTSNIFAAVAKQLEWAVQAGLKLRACPDPECGRAFFSSDDRQRYCPDHRGIAARSKRVRQRKKQGGSWP